ncbi:MAG: serine/threonine protein kinase [Planctomycetaceae bacterium]|nr:serine/threonine protein kinase [Planctomycetaceae bacterium]
MNILRFFRRDHSRTAGPAPHLTFAHSSIGRTISRTGLFLKRQLWIWPILAIVVLVGGGYWVRRAVESTMKGTLGSGLETLLTVQTAMLENWFKTQEANAESMASQQDVRETIYSLLELEEPSEEPVAEKKRTTTPALLTRLRKSLSPGMRAHNYFGYYVVDKNYKIVATSAEEMLNRTLPEQYEPFAKKVLDGHTGVSTPFPSTILMKDEFGRMRTGVPTMFVGSPIRDAAFQVVGALALRIRPENEFTAIMELGRIGETGETYAFDANGMMVSNSRFDDALIRLGLIPDQEHAQSLLTISIRDPGGDMTAGYHPAKRRRDLPFTKAAESAINDKGSGLDVDGYNDDRGVKVVGAWKWMKERDIGVVTEVDAAEAFRPLVILHRTFLALLTLLGICSLAIFLFTVVVARMQREAQKAAIEAKQLGQYRLEQKLGSGGMGVVYRGTHAMLRRPTAIKLLDVDKVNEGSIQRFEREVQITCQLNHPNTVAIYDYGRTPEGVFYYAMEFLDGIDLQTLVDRYGPQPEGRVIKILLQVCGSLYEAHTHGMVHRDVKPANIMLNRRGGEADVVKVLDFGLVKAVDDEKQSKLTSSESLTGTPLYLSPESIQTPNAVDNRADLYAVGAVGYFLLTGRPVFNARSIVELCQMHVSQAPVLPSQILGRPVSSELENALIACLEKSRYKRPTTARDLAHLIARSPAAASWTTDDADAWWNRHERGGAGGLGTSGQHPAPGGGVAGGNGGAGGSATTSSVYDRTIVTNTDD